MQIENPLAKGGFNVSGGPLQIIIAECAMQVSTNRSASQLNVPPGSASSPSAKWKHQLSSPLRWYQRSIARTLVVEIYRLVLRMRAYQREPFLCLGYPLQMPDREGCGAVFGGENTYVDACSKDMLDLSQKYRWATHLDLRMVAEAHRRGAEWGADKLHSE
jgi:hypothetical protein